jgi:hypothetical protein
MRRFRALALAAVFAVVAAPAHPDVPLPTALQVLGTVTNATRPVSNALVIALNLHDFAAIQTWTAVDGRFSLPALRAGVYKIIAVKQGFTPAITTIAPTQPSHKLALQLESEKSARRKSIHQEIWELRGSLPPDVLRELDFALEPPTVLYEVPRFRGEMQSLTGVSGQATNTAAMAQTAVGVQGRLGENWQLGIRGNLHRVENRADDVSFGGGTLAESTGMQMELRSSPTDSYKIATTRSSWLTTENASGADRQVDVRAHNFEWQHGVAHVQVRYFQQENLFAAAPFGSNLIEVTGNAQVLQTRRSDLGVSLRVTQESVESNDDALRTADLSANGTYSLVPSFIVHYGVASRLGVDGQEVAPRTGAEWKLTRGTSLVASGLYKVLDRGPASLVMPSLVFWSDDNRVMPRYAYSFGVVSGRDDNNRLSAIATVSAMDAPLRVVFTDGYDNFWDGLYVESGDVRRDLRVAYRRELGDSFAIDLSTTTGTAESRLADDGRKVYLIGDLQSTFTPTGTTLAVSYREIHQPRGGAAPDYRSERLHVRMAQSLYLPIDMRLLLGIELARADNSPYLLDMTEELSRKYIGGLAFNF